MEASEDFQGFVPISIFIADRRIDGKVWKYASRRLLQQIEDLFLNFEQSLDAVLREDEHLVHLLAVERVALGGSPWWRPRSTSWMGPRSSWWGSSMS